VKRAAPSPAFAAEAGLVHRIAAESCSNSVNKALRYPDEYVNRDGAWRFRSRRMVCDWTEVREVRVGGTSIIAA